MTNDQRTAQTSARYALANLPANTPDWLRAQDITLASRNAQCDQNRRQRQCRDR